MLLRLINPMVNLVILELSVQKNSAKKKVFAIIKYKLDYVRHDSLYNMMII